MQLFFERAFTTEISLKSAFITEISLELEKMIEERLAEFRVLLFFFLILLIFIIMFVVVELRENTPTSIGLPSGTGVYIVATQKNLSSP